MQKLTGQMSDLLTSADEREKFRNGIGFAIIAMGGSQIDDDGTYRRIFQLDTAAGEMTVNIPYESHPSWLGYLFVNFRVPSIADEIIGGVSIAGMKSFSYNADLTAEEAIQDWVNKITPVTTTVPA